MTADREWCTVNAWCALEPGHAGGCSLIHKRQVEAIQEAVDKIKATWQAFAAAFGKPMTQDDYTLHPDPVKCEQCMDTGRITCGHPQCIGIPPCGDPCPHDQVRKAHPEG